MHSTPNPSHPQPPYTPTPTPTPKSPFSWFSQHLWMCWAAGQRAIQGVAGRDCWAASTQIGGQAGYLGGPAHPENHSKRDRTGGTMKGRGAGGMPYEKHSILRDRLGDTPLPGPLGQWLSTVGAQLNSVQLLFLWRSHCECLSQCFFPCVWLQCI